MTDVEGSGTGEVDLATRMYRRRGETRVTDRGDGPPVVFAHGNGFDRTQFDPQVEALSDDYRAVAYDQRSRTEYATEPYDLWDVAGDCAALLDCLDIDSCVLGGLSYGGFMAMRFATAYPALLDGLILIDSRADQHPEHRRNQFAALAEQAREDGEIPDAAFEVQRYEYFGETTREENTDLVDRWEERIRTYPVEAVVNELFCWLERDEFTDRLGEIDVPTLVIHGSEDVSIDPDRGREMAEAIPDARFVEIPDAGHSPTLENPGAVTGAIREFLDETVDDH